MARRDVQLFNISTLDVLSGALGAVIFLFIIVPKGGASASRTTAQAALSYDLRHKQLWGDAADSLQTKKIGDTLLIVIKDLAEMPQAVPCPACPDCPNNGNVAARTPKPRDNNSSVATATPSTPSATTTATTTTTTPTVPTPSGPSYNPNDQKVVGKDDVTITKEQANERKRLDIQPQVPCAVAFEVSWETTKDDNVDFYVVKGKDKVGTYNTSNDAIGKWSSGVTRTRVFEKVDFRTTMEAVRQKDKIIAGNYDLYAHFKATDPKNPKQSLPIKGLIYTKTTQGKEDGKRFTDNLPLNPSSKNGFKKLGTVALRADGSFDFTKN